MNEETLNLFGRALALLEEGKSDLQNTQRVAWKKRVDELLREWQKILSRQRGHRTPQDPPSQSYPDREFTR